MKKAIGIMAMVVSVTTLILAGPSAPDSGAQTSGITTMGSGGSSSSNPVANYFENWFPRVTQIQSEQPHWVTPLVTVTPRLEEEYRYDQLWQTKESRVTVDNYGYNKGLEFIPFDPVEIIIGVPGYEEEYTASPQDGWADETFLLKYRILSANDQNGNYILTAFVGLSIPSGSDDFTSHHYDYTLTVAGGKGWGDFDVQSTLGYSEPSNGFVKTGTGNTLVSNTTFQYRIAKFFWPEVEANYTYWPSGEHEGLNQLLLTPALMIGRIPISGRVGVTCGLGCEIPVTDNPTIYRNVVFSARIPF